MNASERPAPAPDDLTRPYWEAAARHEPVLPRCAACGQLDLPPDIVCRRCGSSDPGWQWEAVSGRGAVRSWTVVRQAFLPGLETPYVLVDVELEEQGDLRSIARLLDGAAATLSVGARVETDFEEAGEWAVPVFRLVDER